MTIENEPDFTLTHGERNSALWAKLKAYFEAELQAQRVRNDSISNDEQKTATIRGHIEFLKHALELGNEPPEIDG